MNQPPMQAYAVTLVFADGLIFGTTVLAPVREAAAAMAMQHAIRDNNAVFGDLTGFALTELTVEWMRATLRQLEGLPGQNISLVSDNPHPANPAPRNPAGRPATVAERLAQQRVTPAPDEGDPA